MISAAKTALRGPIMLSLRKSACAIAATVLVAACATGGGGGGGGVGGGPMPPVQPQNTSAGQPPASYNTGIKGTVASPAPASVGGAPTLATSGGPTFDKSGGSDSFPVITSSLEVTSAGVSVVSSNLGATASFSASGLFTVLHLVIPAANVDAHIDTLASIVANGALLNNDGTGDGLTRGLSYVLLGEWALPTWGGNKSGAAFVFGYSTPAAAMPSTGTATFSGMATANVLKPSGGTIKGTDVWGDANLSVNFSSGTLTGAFTNMKTPDGFGGSMPWNDVSVGASIAAGTNSFSGSTAASSSPNTMFSLSGSATGHIDGAFFGPNAENLGAVWSLSDGVGAALGTVGAARPGPWDY